MSVNLDRHEKGNKECSECFTKPKKCKCGGLIHSEFGDYTSYDSFYLEYACDNPECKENYDTIFDIMENE